MANKNHLRLLDEGREIWNMWRADEKDVDVDLSGAELSGNDLSRYNFSHCNLEGSDLERAVLQNTILFKANLCGVHAAYADFSGSDCEMAQFDQGIFTEASFRDVTFEHTTACHAIMDLTSWTSSKIRQSKFFGSNLLCSYFDGALIQDTVFKNARLSYMSVKGAQLTNVDFSSSVMVSFDGRGVDFSKCLFLKTDASSANFRRSLFTGKKFIGCTFDNASFEDANLRGVAFGESSLKNTIFTGADLRETEFMYALINRTVFPDTDIMLNSMWGNIHIQHHVICIGCQRRTVEEWLTLDEAMLSDESIAYYEQWSPCIKLLADTCEPYPGEERRHE